MAELLKRAYLARPLSVCPGPSCLSEWPTAAYLLMQLYLSDPFAFGPKRVSRPVALVGSKWMVKRVVLQTQTKRAKTARRALVRVSWRPTYARQLFAGR